MDTFSQILSVSDQIIKKYQYKSRNLPKISLTEKLRKATVQRWLALPIGYTYCMQTPQIYEEPKFMTFDMMAQVEDLSTTSNPMPYP